MKNLKRIFSLALAGTMLAGMMAVGASAADFSDASDINNTEAVDTMVALEIIKGNDDGSFAPERTVSRAEMAKMITIMLNGGKEPALTSTADNAKFTDIGGHWAQKYIEYCVSQDVIAGRGDGTFGPDATVTGTEAAKMALTALGYNSDVFHFTGADWAINVNAAANAPSANLYEGIRSIDPSAGLSRDNAAQMLYNALDAYVVELKYDYSSDGVTTNYAISDTKTMMSEKFDAVKVEGVVVANEIASIRNGNTSATKEGKTIINVETEESTVWKNDVTLNVTTDLDLIGRTVSVYVKNNGKNKDATVIGGVVLSDSNKVYTNADGEVFNDIEDGVETDSATKYFQNYAAIDGAAPTEGTAGVTTILVDNDNDDVVDYVFLVEYSVAQVAKINTKDEEIRFNGGKSSAENSMGTVEYDNLFGYEDLEVDDIVLSTKIGDKYYLEVPETVEGQIEEYKLDGAKATKLTVDGTTYDVADVDNTVADLVAANTLGEDNLDDQGIFYLDANGMIVAYTESEAAAAQYAISWGGASGNKLDSNRIKLTLEDGTTAVYTIHKDSDLKISEDNNGAEFSGEGVTEANKNAVGALVAYTIKSNGQVTLSLPEKTGTVADEAGKEFEQGKTLVGDNSATSRTVFFFVDLKDGDVDDVEIYTGYKNAPTVEDFKDGGKINLALDKNGDKVVAAAFIDAKKATDEAKLADHLWVKKLGTSNKDYTNVTAIMEDGSEEVIKVAADDKALKDHGKEHIYTYSINSDGYYELTFAEDNSEGSDYEDNYNAGEVYYVSSDTVVLTVDDVKVEYLMTSDTVEYDHADDSALEKGAKVRVLVNDDKEILMIVVVEAAPDEE